MKKILNVVFALMFVAGFLLLTYPTISDQWNTYRQSRLISSYEEAVSTMEPEDFSEEWEKARAFNDTLTENNIYGDVFAGEDEDLEDTEYWSVLNAAGDGVMGYISIPKINVKLSIYHGTSDDILQTGVGHLDGTKLPIGGESTHCVLAAHRGLPSARLFTDLDKLKEGDLFTLRVLEESLTYEVDQILIVEPEDMEALAIDPMQDYCTLITCTPYGINSHRLLVRGHRVLLAEETEPEKTEEDHFPVLPVALAVPAAAVMAALLVKCRSRKKKKRRKEISDRK